MPEKSSTVESLGIIEHKGNTSAATTGKKGNIPRQIRSLSFSIS